MCGVIRVYHWVVVYYHWPVDDCTFRKNFTRANLADVRRVPAEYEIGVKKPEQINFRITLLTSGAFRWERVGTLLESHQSHVCILRNVVRKLMIQLVKTNLMKNCMDFHPLTSPTTTRMFSVSQYQKI